jgi:hypothetical protein
MEARLFQIFVLKNHNMRIIVFLFLAFNCFACASKKQENNQQPAVPEALQDNKSKSADYFKRRPDDDLVEELYREKLKTSPALQSIEEIIGMLEQSKRDSTEVFHDFANKNNSYFSSAGNKRNTILDSLLKKEIDAILVRSKSRYENSISNLKNADSLLNSKPTAVNDRYLVLKILISLGMMEEYRKDNLPSTKPIQVIINEYDRLLNRQDSAINKNK